VRYVLIRDDDVNALTPPEHLERLHRPFLDRGLPVNLAVIPKVYSDLSLPGGAPAGFLVAKRGNPPKALTLATNATLVQYLRANPGYHLAMHGYHHSEREFGPDGGLTPRGHRRDIAYRLERGMKLFHEMGLPAPVAFVPPDNALCRVSLVELARQFRVISSDQFVYADVPWNWSLGYGWRALFSAPHWRAGRTRFLTHPPSPVWGLADGASMVSAVEALVARQRLTVLPLQWWEFYPGNEPNPGAIAAYHALAEWPAQRSDVKAVTFLDVAEGRVPLR